MKEAKILLVLLAIIIGGGYVFTSLRLFFDPPVVSFSPIATSTEISSYPLATSSLSQHISHTASSTAFSRPASSPSPQATTSLSLPNSAASPASPIPQPDFESINALARPAIVNILCEAKTVSGLQPITATGIVTDPRGIILTNAHVAQYLLLRNYPYPDSIQCTIRTGSPASSRYTAELVYISPQWVKDNSTILTETEPKGTGENDFAFLRITGTIDGTPLPASFPYLPPNAREIIQTGEQVDLVSYPAGFLGGLSILQNLNLTSALTTIQDVFTFKEDTIDLISVPGTVVSQKGASGGAVVDKNTTLIGMITTSSDGTTTSERDLRAITLAHINRSLLQYEHMSLSTFFSQDMAAYASSFNTNTAPALADLIIKNISH